MKRSLTDLEPFSCQTLNSQSQVRIANMSEWPLRKFILSFKRDSCAK